MNLTLNRFVITTAVFVLIVCITNWLWSDHKIAQLERDVGDAKAAASEKQQLAEEKEKESNEYKAKIEYLEQERDALNAARQKQDDELKKLSANTDNARNSVRRARVTSSNPATADELCAKLERLEHPCR